MKTKDYVGMLLIGAACAVEGYVAIKHADYTDPLNRSYALAAAISAVSGSIVSVIASYTNCIEYSRPDNVGLDIFRPSQ